MANPKSEDDGLTARWEATRLLERDLEYAMARGNRMSDGLGYAAVAQILQERGWTKDRPPPPPPKHSDEVVVPFREEVDAILDRHGLTVAALREAKQGPAARNVTTARREVYLFLIGKDVTPVQIARAFHRDRTSVHFILYGRRDRPETLTHRAA